MRRSLLLSAVLFTACAKQAPAPAAEPVAAVEPAGVVDDARPLTLWQVDKDGLQTSYLFGTCHMGVSIEEALPQEYEPFLTDADLFVMEVDPGTMVTPQVIARMQLPEGQTMSGLLGEETWQEILQEFDLQAAAANLDPLHPFVVLTQLSSVVLLRQGADLNRSAGAMDLGLSSMAQQSGVEQAWLEEVNDQLDVLLGAPMDDYLQGIREYRDPEVQAQSVESTTATLDLCRTGDIGPALAIMQADDSDLMDQLMVQRNRNWIPVLEDYFSRGSAFVAAGAGHMIGDDSVVSLLEDQGYTITRLSGVTRPAPEATSQPGTPREAFTQIMGSQVSTMLCSDAQPLKQCFDVDTSACVATYSEAAHLCEQSLEVPQIIPAEEAQAWGAKIGGCMQDHFTATYAEQLVDDAACAPFATTTSE